MRNDENYYGIYKKGCGLDNVVVSWGHDENKKRVKFQNNRKIPYTF